MSAVLVVAQGDPIAARWLNRHRAEFEARGVTIRTSSLPPPGYGLLTITGMALPTIIVFDDDENGHLVSWDDTPR